MPGPGESQDDAVGGLTISGTKLVHAIQRNAPYGAAAASRLIPSLLGGDSERGFPDAGLM